MLNAYVLVRTQHSLDYVKPEVTVAYNVYYNMQSFSKKPYTLSPSLRWAESAPLDDPVPPRKKRIIIAAGIAKAPGIDIEILRAVYVRTFIYEELIGRACAEMRDAMSYGPLGLQWYGNEENFHTGGHIRYASNSIQRAERHVWWDIVELPVDLD